MIMTPREVFIAVSLRIAVRSRLSSSTGYVGLAWSIRERGSIATHIGEYDAKTNAICDLSHIRLSN